MIKIQTYDASTDEAVIDVLRNYVVEIDPDEHVADPFDIEVIGTRWNAIGDEQLIYGWLVDADGDRVEPNVLKSWPLDACTITVY